MSLQNTAQKKQRQFNSYFTLVVTFLFICCITFLITSGIKDADKQSIDNKSMCNNLWFLLFLLVSIASIVIIFIMRQPQYINKFRSKSGS
jgi:formate hydrogenlyase subunit 3/multisubunit Na+/H+ antiporter MnhD subunit